MRERFMELKGRDAATRKNSKSPSHKQIESHVTGATRGGTAQKIVYSRLSLSHVGCLGSED